MYKQYTLFKRPSKKYGYVWYCRFRDENGNRLTAVSTNQTSKGAAENWTIQQLANGMVRKDIRFATYAQAFWNYDKCTYIQGKLARGGAVLTSPHTLVHFQS